MNKSLKQNGVFCKHKSSGCLNVFKCDLRCQHDVHQASKNMKESKYTGCHAILKITVQRNLNYSSKIVKCSKRKCNLIPVQPTAIARRKSFYCGRSQVGGRRIKRTLPSALKEHSYGNFCELPTKQPKTKHSLAHCVERNVLLPN